MQLKPTPPPKVIVILMEISINCGNAGRATCKRVGSVLYIITVPLRTYWHLVLLAFFIW